MCVNGAERVEELAQAHRVWIVKVTCSRQRILGHITTSGPLLMFSNGCSLVSFKHKKDFWKRSNFGWSPPKPVSVVNVEKPSLLIQIWSDVTQDEVTFSSFTHVTFSVCLTPWRIIWCFPGSFSKVIIYYQISLGLNTQLYKGFDRGLVVLYI